MEAEKIGEYAFLLGIAVAVITGVATLATDALVAYASETALLLAVLGIVVGFVNVSEKNATAFLVAAIALVTAGTASFSAINVAGLGAILNTVIGNIAVLVSPAAVIVAVKAVYNHANGR